MKNIEAVRHNARLKLTSSFLGKLSLICFVAGFALWQIKGDGQATVVGSIAGVVLAGLSIKILGR